MPVMKVAFITGRFEGHSSSTAVVGCVLASVGLAGQHLADLSNAGLAVSARLTAVLDRLQRAGATADLFGDAAVGDTFADADEHADLLEPWRGPETGGSIESRFQCSGSL
jgi:hypothetical protein